MSTKGLKQLAVEAEALAKATPGHPVDSAFDKWSGRLRGLVAKLTVDGASAPQEWIKAELTSAALGDLIGGLRTTWQYASGAYTASNQALVAKALNAIAAALHSGTAASSGGVFVSFSHRDEPLAALLFDALDSAGLAPFKSSDPAKGLPAGKGYFENLVKKLGSVECLVLLATQASTTEAWPVFEAGAVVVRGCPVLSVCVDVGVEKLPGPLQPIQAVAAADRNKVKHFLAQVVGREVGDLWTGEALMKLDAFLDAAVPRLKPEHSAVGKVLTEYDPFADA